MTRKDIIIGLITIILYIQVLLLHVNASQNVRITQNFASLRSPNNFNTEVSEFSNTSKLSSGATNSTFAEFGETLPHTNVIFNDIVRVASKSYLLDTDGDGIADVYDLDSDNDGIWDVDEGAKICTGASGKPMNTVPYAWNTKFNSSASHSPISLNNLYSKTLNFTATLHGTTTWAGGMELRQISGVDYIYLQPNNSTGGANYAKYVLSFSVAVSGLSFLSTGLNVFDAFEIYAFDANNNVIALTASNVSDYIPNAAGYTVSEVGDAVKIVGIINDGSGAIDDKSFKTTIPGNVSKIEIIAYKNNGSTSNVTVGLAQFVYCTINNDLDTDGDGIPDYLDLDSDGDGCPDAIEGDEKVFESHLNSSGSINTAANGGVDAFGTPNLVNNGGAADVGGDKGQGIGNARNANVNSCNKIWVGSISTSWDNSSNWKTVEEPFPASKDNVEFATVANNEGVAAINNLYVPNATEKNIGNLTNLSTKALVIPAGAGLKVDGKVVGSESNTDRIQINAATDGTTPNGSLIVDCDKNSANTIQATVQLYAKGYKGTAHTWTDNIVGSPTLGQTFSSSYKWQHFGVPVTSIAANPTFAGGFLREYVESKNASNSYYNKWDDLTNASTLSAFKGYAITQNNPTIYTVKGALQFCDHQITLYRTAPVVSGSTDPNINNSRYGLGQNIIGNSFTAAIPISQINFDNIVLNGVPTSNADGSLVEKTVYLYNTGSFGDWTGASTSNSATAAGSYIAVPSNVGDAIYAQIPSMQGFLLRHTGQINDIITMTLPYASLVKNNKPQTAPRKPLSYLELELKSESTVDKLWLFSVAGTSPGFDNGWDGRKFFGTPTAFIYSPTPDGNMQVNTTNSIVGSSIAFVANNDNNYTLQVKKINLDSEYSQLYLLDYLERKSIRLDADLTIYNFSASNAGVSTLRFAISDVPDVDVRFEKNLSAHVYANTLHAFNHTNTRSTLQVISATGQLLYQKSIDALSFITEKVNFQKGIYIIVLRSDYGDFSKKISIN